MRVLMSIKPEFVKKIVTGEKTFEFRKTMFKREDVQTIVVYASRPVSKIIGEFSIEEVLSDRPERIWNITNKESGITKNYFDTYFSGKKIAHAISINKFKKYATPRNLNSVNVLRAPQSFCYIE